MAVVPQWLKGTNVSGVVITGQVVAADGTLSDAATTGVQPLTAVVDEITGPTFAPRVEEISAMTVDKENDVIIKKRATLRVQCIMEKSRAGLGANDKINPLEWIAVTYDYVKLVFVRGGRTWTHIGPVVGYDEQIRAGRSVNILDVGMAGIDTTNPAIV